MAEALDYGIGAIEHGQDWNAPAPIAAIGQARRAARTGVRLETVLRRYTAGDRELAIYVVEEAHGLPHKLRQEIERTQSMSVDRLIEAVASEYRSELDRIERSPATPLEERIRRLLDGDLTVDLEPDYDLGSRHVGVIARGTTAESAIRRAAKELDSRLLVARGISPNPSAWLSRSGGLDVGEIERVIAALTTTASFAFGESRSGVEGWRLTHFEARMAFEAMRHGGGGLSIARARDVLLQAAVLRDQVLTQALLTTYMKPLDGDGDGDENGENLRQTLRAYLSTGLQASAAAELLPVHRKTVESRLREIESRLGQRIEDCHAQIAVALEVEGLVRPGASPNVSEVNDELDSGPADGA